MKNLTIPLLLALLFPSLANAQGPTAYHCTYGDLVRRVEKIETAIEPKFQEHFVNASAMPNAADPFPILRSVVPLPDLSFNAGEASPAGGRRRRRRG